MMLTFSLVISFLFAVTPIAHANFINPHLNIKNGDAIPIEAIKSNTLKVYFAPLLNVENISYLLTYTADEIPQGVEGSFDPGKKLAIMKTIFLGTCSQNSCVKHSNIEDLKLEVNFEFKDGSNQIKQYAIDNPFFY